MALRRSTARRLSRWPVLTLPADPGPALLELARRYDPQAQRLHNPLISRRIQFRNHLLLIGPVTVGPPQAAELGWQHVAAVSVLAWYACASGSRQAPDRDAARAAGGKLVRALARRLGGMTCPPDLQPDLGLSVSVYSRQNLPVSATVEVLRPYAGDLTVEDVAHGSFSLTGKDMPFYTAYWPPTSNGQLPLPPAVGPLYGRPVHQWDLVSGQRADQPPAGLCQVMGAAALALAAACNGIAVDMFGFPVTQPEDLQPG